MSTARPQSTATAQAAPTAKQQRVINLARQLLATTGGVSLPTIIDGMKAAYTAGNTEFLSACLALAYNISKNAEGMFQAMEDITPEVFRMEGDRKDHMDKRINHNINSTAVRVAGQLMMMVSTHPRAEELKRQKGNTFFTEHVLGSQKNIDLQKEAHAQYFPAYQQLTAPAKEEIAKMAAAGFRTVE